MLCSVRSMENTYSSLFLISISTLSTSSTIISISQVYTGLVHTPHFDTLLFPDARRYDNLNCQPYAHSNTVGDSGFFKELIIIYKLYHTRFKK